MANPESIEGPPQEVLMLSTDLAVWSWLTLESDLALGAQQHRRRRA